MKIRFSLKLACFALLSSFILSSCNKWEDDVNDLKKRVEALERAQAQANDNISAMQQLVSAFQAADYITEVTPLVENGVDKGYTIKFKQRAPITVYHGNAPRISVKQDADLSWYWTYNDSWLNDGNGNKILATGVTPRLRIENGRWMVSTDNGFSWSDAGQATGADGVDGANGQDGRDGVDGSNSFITSLVDNTDSYTITFTNGQKLTFTKAQPFVDRILTSTDIPDQAFREWLITVYDSNKDGQLQHSEIAYIKRVDLPGSSSYYKINSIVGIEYFLALEHFAANYTDISSIDLSGNNNLIDIYIHTNPLLTTIDVSGCSQLDFLYLYNNSLTTLDLSSNKALRSLDCQNNQLTSLILDNPTLNHLSCSDNLLTTIDISKCYSVSYFSANSMPTLSKVFVWNGFNTTVTPPYYYVGAGVTFEVKP